MSKEIFQIKLKRNHIIYDGGNEYIIESEMGSNGKQRVQRSYSKSLVKIFESLLGGNDWTVDEAMAEIENSALVRYLEYYGYKRRYEIQDILMCIAASGRSVVRKEGRGYLYQVY